MRHRVKVVPVKVNRREDELGCYVRRVVGYRAVCDCGERGPVRTTVHEARRDAPLLSQTACTIAPKPGQS